MEVVFKRNDFTICDVTVPKGYPQSQTHVGVARDGKKTILVSSPFPSVKYTKWCTYIRVALRKLSFGKLFKVVRGEYFENPCLYMIGDGINFNLMQSRPLMVCLLLTPTPTCLLIMIQYMFLIVPFLGPN